MFISSGGNGTSHVGDELRILAESATHTLITSQLAIVNRRDSGNHMSWMRSQLSGRATLGNISTRLQVGTGDRVMIAGFIVQGSAPKRVIIRAAGPSLTQFGVPNALANPRLELHDGLAPSG